MENKKEGILKKFWSKLKNFWNNLGIDVVDYKFTDKGFQNEINNRGMDERYKALQYNSADNCAVNVAIEVNNIGLQKKILRMNNIFLDI